MEILRSLFTGQDGQPAALTFEQFLEKLNAAKEIKLANLAEGGYVSVDKFKAEEAKATGLQEQLTAANQQIQTFKGMDIEAIKKAAADWETKYNTDTQALNDKIAKMQLDHQKDLLFSRIKFRDEFSEAGVRAAFDKQEFKVDKDGKYVGAEAWLDGLQKDEKTKSAFVLDTPAPAPEPTPTPAPAPAKPKPKFADPAPKQPTPKPRPKLSELMQQKNEHPDAVITFETPTTE